ncbi:MAG: hypothetical protein ACPLY7_01115, partial [Microgenomates group bacterium]
ALRGHFLKQKIVCVFDPAMTGLKYSESLSWYERAFDSADQVIVGKVSFLRSIAKEKRVKGNDLVKAIVKTQPQVFYEPVDEKIVDWLGKKTAESDVIVFMSSGGLRFIKLIEKTKKVLDAFAGFDPTTTARRDKWT